MFAANIDVRPMEFHRSLGAPMTPDVSILMDAVFQAPDLLEVLETCDAAMLDRLAFGVIRLDRDGVVVDYNSFESEKAGLSRARVVGLHFFTSVGPCMNNALVAQRFENEDSLDDTIDYLFTFVMRPTPVRLRMLKAARSRFMYLVVERL